MNWIKLLSTEELKDIYFNAPKIKQYALLELNNRGVELKGDKFNMPLLRSQISIQRFLKSCGFDMLISGGNPADKHHVLKWNIKHSCAVMEYIKSVSKNQYIQLCGVQLTVIESLNDVCHFSIYTGENTHPDSDIKKPFIKLLKEPIFSKEILNWRVDN